MKTTKNKIVVLIVFLMAHLSIYAQYSGGSSDGSSLDIVSITSCSTPSHFYAYFGGNADGASVETILNTTCGFSNHFYAYFGGNGDASNVEELSQTSCGFPAHFYAYFGGNDDGSGVETLNSTTCAFPPQFYAYFGGDGDGFSLDKTGPVCPTTPPVASFTASTNTSCIGQSVTYTDTSTNIPSAWLWTFPGGTPATSTAQNPVVVYNTAGIYNATLVATNYNGSDTKTEIGFETITGFPTVTSTTPASVCGSGAVTLLATASAGTLNWYANSTGGTSIGTGNSFTTPSIAATTTFYAEAVNATCVSTSRTAVVASVLAFPIVTAANAFPPICESGTSLGSVSTTSGNSVRWFNVPTGGTILGSSLVFTTPTISTTTTFYCEAYNANCTGSRLAIVVTVKPIPTITTNDVTGCASSAVTLTATASAGILNWWTTSVAGTNVGSGNSFTTPILTANQTYYVAATDNGCTSPRVPVTAIIDAAAQVTSTTPDRNCSPGNVTVVATPSAGSTIIWYATATGSTILATGNSYTDTINVTTTYYAAATNGTCTSPRVAVTGTIDVIPIVTAANAFPPICGSGTSLGSVLTTSGNSVRWFNVPTGGTVLGSSTVFTTHTISTTTTFYCEAYNANCTGPRLAIVVTVKPIPTIDSTTPNSGCIGTAITLNATASAGTLNWWTTSVAGTNVGSGNSFTTPILTADHTYYVAATDNGCTSPRVPVTATVSPVPIINTTTGASICDSGTVTLSANSSAGTLNWYANATGGTSLATGTSFTTPSISTTTTYFVEALNSGCASSRTPVIATVNVSPTITSTIPASICDSGAVSLSAFASAGNVVWFANATGGTPLATTNSFTTPSISITTTYYVEAVNGSCTSTRTPVIATVNVTPAVVSTMPDGRCGSGTVTLGATASTGTLNWYNNAIGGSLLGSGNSFTTPNIGGTTTYYVEATNSSCTSPRTAVTASVDIVAAPTGNANQTFCAGETLGQLVVSGTNIIWYDAPTIGSVITNSTLLVSGTTYYATQTPTSCESDTRFAVNVTSGNCLSNDDFKLDDLKIYPNPVIDILNISYSDIISKVEINNILGQLIKSQSVNSNETQIDLSGYAGGAYLVKVSVDNKVKIFKIIKK
jgi:hypothetical protein